MKKRGGKAEIEKGKIEIGMDDGEVEKDRYRRWGGRRNGKIWRK